MKSRFQVAALSILAAALVLCAAQSAKADRYVYRSYYAGPYYAGTTVEYRRPFTPFYAPRVAYYPAGVPVYSPPVYSAYYPAPVYAAPVVAPTVVNYPRRTVYYNYGPTYAPPVPAVVYPLPSVVYPPAVFGY